MKTLNHDYLLWYEITNKIKTEYMTSLNDYYSGDLRQRSLLFVFLVIDFLALRYLASIIVILEHSTISWTFPLMQISFSCLLLVSIKFVYKRYTIPHVSSCTYSSLHHFSSIFLPVNIFNHFNHDFRGPKEGAFETPLASCSKDPSKALDSPADHDRDSHHAFCKAH